MSEGVFMTLKNGGDKAISHVCYLLGINPSQWTILNTMIDRENNNTISCKDLQDELDLDSSYVSRVLSRLVNKGLVSREYAFVNHGRPRYCYEPIGRKEIEALLNEKIVAISNELQSVGLCVSVVSEGNDGLTEKDN